MIGPFPGVLTDAHASFPVNNSKVSVCCYDCASLCDLRRLRYLGVGSSCSTGAARPTVSVWRQQRLHSLGYRRGDGQVNGERQRKGSGGGGKPMNSAEHPTTKLLQRCQTNRAVLLRSTSKPTPFCLRECYND